MMLDVTAQASDAIPFSVRSMKEPEKRRKEMGKHDKRGLAAFSKSIV